MSERPVVKKNIGIRTDALDHYEKKELTHFLRDLKLGMDQGKVVIHFSQGGVSKVEPQPVLM
jgi:hypothetical protein